VTEYLLESFLEWARWLAHAIAVEAPVHLTMDRVLMKEKIFTGQPVNCNGVGKGQLGLVAHFFYLLRFEHEIVHPICGTLRS